MIKSNPLRYTIIGLCLILVPLLLFGQDSLQVQYLMPQSIYRFAKHLYEQKDYQRAASEFERYLFLSSSKESTDSIFYLIGKCYSLGGKYEKALGYFQRINSHSRYADLAIYQIGYSHFLSFNYSYCIQYLKENIPQITNPQIQLKSSQLIGLCYLYEKKWGTAERFCSRLMRENTPDSVTKLLKVFAVEGKNLPYKSKLVAGVLSSIIPGTGKIYTGRPKDGLFSLGIIGLTGWQAYDAFHKHGINSTRFWIYGIVSSAFYLGNIYGSAISARIYNETRETKLLQKVEVVIHTYF